MILAWIILSFVVAFIGSDRKIGYFGTLILSLLLSPIIGAIFALASDRKQDFSDLKKCPFCAEYIKHEAVFCKHCGKSLESVENKADFDIDKLRK